MLFRSEMLNGFAFFTQDDEKLNLTIDPRNGTVVKGKAQAGRKGADQAGD